MHIAARVVHGRSSATVSWKTILRTFVIATLLAVATISIKQCGNSDDWHGGDGGAGNRM